MICAAQTMVDLHPEVAEQVALLFVVGEEVDHVGMQVRPAGTATYYPLASFLFTLPHRIQEKLSPYSIKYTLQIIGKLPLMTVLVLTIYGRFRFVIHQPGDGVTQRSISAEWGSFQFCMGKFSDFEKTEFLKFFP